MRPTDPWVPGERIATVRADPADGELPPDAPTIGVLALQGDVIEHLRALTAVGARAVRVRRLEDLDGLDGIVIPGGESTTIGKLLDAFGLFEPLRAVIHGGLPAFGTCAGLILLSDQLDQDRPQPVLGGLDVTTRRNAFGRQVMSFETDLDVAGLDGGPLHAVFIRAPGIVRTGPDVHVLAEVGDYPVLVQQGHLLAAAFHPEVTADRRLHERFVSYVRERARTRRDAV